MRFSDYYACPFCGASLDPGERCDCQEEKEPQWIHQAREADRSPQLMRPSRYYHRPAGIAPAIFHA